MKNIKEEASRLFKSAPSFRGGIVMGLQLVRDTLQLTDAQKEEINQVIDIISGVSSYKKPAPRPAEIKKIEKEVDEAINPEIASEPEAKTLPRREDPLDTPPPKPKVKDEPKKEDHKPVVKKPKIRRPWDKDPSVIRRPKR